MDTVACGVLAADEQDHFAIAAFGELGAQGSNQICPVWRPQPAERARCDLLVIAACAENFDSVVTETTHLRALLPACAVIVVCVDLASEQIGALLAAGAFDFVSTPYSGRELRARVRRAAGLLPERRSNDSAALELARSHSLIGLSPAFLKQVSALPMIAGCDAGVLILGETGTGKEVYARAIHYLSARAARPWVAVNCGAIPTELMESELFGHVRGAFTSAYAARCGLVREAEGGTLFLDEVDLLPVPAQAKLLRFLQGKEYRPVGGTGVSYADVRVIAATNRDLSVLSGRGNFRQDLYFRLNVINPVMPPLRERREDIPALAQHFIDLCSQQSRRPRPRLAPDALRRLLTYDWPGNVRELHNVIERAALLSRSAVIRGCDFGLTSAAAEEDSGESFRTAKARVVKTFERDYIERMLLANDGNVSRAARAARKNRRAFFELMKKHQIRPHQFRVQIPSPL
jgi:two-component system response regulator GlrR